MAEQTKTKKATSGKGNKVASIVSRVEVNYKENIVPALIKKFNYTSVMQVPHL